MELLFFLGHEWHIDMVGLSLNQYRTSGNTSKINESIFPASDIQSPPYRTGFLECSYLLNQVR